MDIRDLNKRNLGLGDDLVKYQELLKGAIQEGEGYSDGVRAVKRNKFDTKTLKEKAKTRAEKCRSGDNYSCGVENALRDELTDRAGGNSQKRFEKRLDLFPHNKF